MIFFSSKDESYVVCGSCSSTDRCYMSGLEIAVEEVSKRSPEHGHKPHMHPTTPAGRRAALDAVRTLLFNCHRRAWIVISLRLYDMGVWVFFSGRKQGPSFTELPIFMLFSNNVIPCYLIGLSFHFMDFIALYLSLLR